ncbi:MAG: type II toxin-antitoxin system PrlF family antitoxin [Leptospirales bacterium]
MAPPIEVESTLTDRYQTTVPVIVRHALNLGKGDKIHYTIRQEGEVVLTRTASPEADDPVLEAFLAFLSRDIARHPERLRTIDASLVGRIGSLVAGLEVDLDETLSVEDE